MDGKQAGTEVQSAGEPAVPEAGGQLVCTLCGYVLKSFYHYPGRAGGMYGVLGL